MSGRWLVLCSAFALGVGCDDGGGADAGGGLDAAAMDAGSSDGGGGDPDASADAPGPARALGAGCTEDGQCASGTCFHATSGIELGTGYCSLPCTGDAQCVGFPSDGYDYGCVSTGAVTACGRRCPGGRGCQAGDLCVEDFGVAGTDICLDLSDVLCTSDADCTGVHDLCTVLTDQERAITACFHARGFDGEPVPFKRPGDACTILPETPCTTSDDCPTNFRCQRRASEGRDVCNPIPSETCHLLCLLPGRCSGICETDADCPADMRCSDTVLNFYGNTPGAFDDGPFYSLRGCTYAAGSRTACSAEGDCDTTGTAGADEICWPGGAADGSWEPICVEPTGAGEPGDPCGDDPTTDIVENRLCDGACIFNRCAELCDTTADCPTGQCIQIVQSATVTHGACIPGATCADDGDCGATEVCSDVFDAVGAVISICTPSQGALSGGARCEVGGSPFVPVSARCASGCEDTGRGRAEGRCRERCDTDADCPGADFVCSQVTFTVSSGGTYPDRTDDVNTTLRSCTYAPGSRDVCTADADCPSGEVCSVLFDIAGAAQRRCVTENAGGVSAGATCSASIRCRDPGRCMSRWDDPTTQFCSAFCARDADCPTGFACRTPNLDIPSFDLPICMPTDDPRGLPL